MSKEKLQQLHEMLSEEELNELREFSDHNEKSIQNWLNDTSSDEKFNKPQLLINNLLIEAAEKGDEDTVNFLLTKKIYQNKRDHILHVAMSAARKADQQNIIDILKKYGIEPQKKLRYETTTEKDGEKIANIIIVDRYNLLELSEIKKWFDQECFDNLKFVREEGMIRIIVKDVRLYEVLNVLHENYLVLEDASVKLLYKTFLELGRLKTSHRHASVNNKKSIAPIQKIIQVFEDIYNQFFKILPEDVKSKIYKKRKPVVEKPVNIKLIDYALKQIFMGVQHEEMTDHIRNQWVAYAPNPICDENLLVSTDGFVNELINYNNRCKLNFDTLSADAKSALQNIIVYGEKLWKEREAIPANTKKKVILNEKIEALSVFLREIIMQEELTEEFIQKSYNKLQQKDHNRGTRFYLFYTAANKMWYTTEGGWQMPVQSTMGELGFYVKQTLMSQLKNEKEAKESDKSIAEDESVSSKI